MADESKNDPAKKMRNLLGASANSPIKNLPKKEEPAPAFMPAEDDVDVTRTLPQATSRPASSSNSRETSRSHLGPTFWTIASVISLIMNGILILVLIIILFNLPKFQVGSALTMGNSLLGGLYTNFEKMDRADITTNVQVDTTIPVKFDMQLNQQTNVVLSQDVRIDNARVTVNTGGLNITNALTTIVLPQGTTLPVVLNLTVPVDTTVPVTLNVPVNIPLDQTELHEPFVGLQDVVRPFYCIVNSSAVNLDGLPLCN
jgi:hypothetical protein